MKYKTKVVIENISKSSYFFSDEKGNTIVHVPPFYSEEFYFSDEEFIEELRKDVILSDRIIKIYRNDKKFIDKKNEQNVDNVYDSNIESDQRSNRDDDVNISKEVSDTVPEI